MKKQWAVTSLYAMILLSGCVVGSDGNFESLSGTGTGGADSASSTGASGGTADETGFPPGAVECDFELGANPLNQSACSIDEDCCAAELVPTGLVGNAACPGTEFPANWSCESGTCRQRHSPTADQGCSVAADCIFDNFICTIVDGVGHCVVPCLFDSDCTEENNMPDTHCGGAGAQAFCMQDQP